MDETERINQYCAVREGLHRQYAEQLGYGREAAVVGGRVTLRDATTDGDLRQAVDDLARAACRRVYLAGLTPLPAPGTAGGDLTDRDAAANKTAGQVRSIVEHAHRRGMQVGVELGECLRAWLTGLPGDGTGGPYDGDEMDGLALLQQEERRRLLDQMGWLRHDLGVDCIYAAMEGGGPSDPLCRAFQGWSDGAKKRPARQVRGLAPAGAWLLRELHRLGFGLCMQGVPGLACPGAAPPGDRVDGNEFMFRDSELGLPEEEPGRSLPDPEALFRACANRMTRVVDYPFGTARRRRLGGWANRDCTRIHKAYHAVRDHMVYSRHLPDGRGVLWQGLEPDVRVLWAFKAFTWDAGERGEVFDVMAGKTVDQQGGKLSAGRGTVYLIQSPCDE
jgi:hypothetical protein